MSALPRTRGPTSLEATLAEGIDALGLTLDEARQRRLIEFLALLGKWNGVYNLTSVRDVADMLVVHVLDSLSILPLLDALAPRTLIDVGSGAGIPAIPLAIARPALVVHAVDAVAKKIAFQLQAKAALRLDNLQPVHTRIERVELPESPSVIVSRAYTDLPAMLASIDHLASDRTTVVAMKGVTPDAELAALPAGWCAERVVQLDVPFLGAARCAVVLKRRASLLP